LFAGFICALKLLGRGLALGGGNNATLTFIERHFSKEKTSSLIEGVGVL